jgi:hypothetical protein
MRAHALHSLLIALCVQSCWLTQSVDSLRIRPNASSTTPDASSSTPTDAAGGAAVLSCADAGVILCEDFEHDLDPAVWSTRTSPGSMASTDATHFHHGQRSLRAMTGGVADNQNQPPYAVLSMHPPSLGSSFFVRLFVYAHTNPLFPESVSPGSGEGLIFLTEARAPYNGMSVGLRQSGFFDWDTWTNSPPDVAATMQPVTLDAWTCVEWGVAGSTTTVWVNDGKEPVITVSPTPPLSLGIAKFGLQVEHSAQHYPTYELWIDDVIIDTSRIGCDK